MKIAALTVLSMIAGISLCADAVRAQLPPMEVAGDPRAALEKDWGPLPIPAGAIYESACSTKRRTAVFFLGLKVDPATYSRAHSEYRVKRAAIDADRKAGRAVTLEQMMAVVQTADGTPETRALIEKTVSFLKSRGMIPIDPGLLQMPSNTAKVKSIGYTLAAQVNQGGILGICESAGGPTLEFGRR